MTMIDFMLWIDALWRTFVEFAQGIWRDLTELLLDLWHIWTIMFPKDPMWDPYGSAITLVIAFCMLLWFLPKERY